MLLSDKLLVSSQKSGTRQTKASWNRKRNRVRGADMRGEEEKMVKEPVAKRNREPEREPSAKFASPNWEVIFPQFRRGVECGGHPIDFQTRRDSYTVRWNIYGFGYRRLQRNQKCICVPDPVSEMTHDPGIRLSTYEKSFPLQRYHNNSLCDSYSPGRCFAVRV